MTVSGAAAAASCLLFLFLFLEPIVVLSRSSSPGSFPPFDLHGTSLVDEPPQGANGGPVHPPGVLPPAPISNVNGQVVNLLEALRDAGQFGAIAGLLDGLQMQRLSPMTTWLLPTDNAFADSIPANVTRFINYHVLRELLPYSRLTSLAVGTRLPTFLGTESVMVTSNQGVNFSVDNAMIVVPDLYGDSTISVHGINAILDDAHFNEVVDSPSVSPAPKQAPVESPSSSPLIPILPAPLPSSCDNLVAAVTELYNLCFFLCLLWLSSG